MKSVNATNLDRESGEAEGSAVFFISYKSDRKSGAERATVCFYFRIKNRDGYESVCSLLLNNASSSNKIPPITMAESATLKSGQW